MNNIGQSRLDVLICYRGDYAPLFMCKDKKIPRRRAGDRISWNQRLLN